MTNKKELIAASLTIYDNNDKINDAAMMTLWDKTLREGADGFFIGGNHIKVQSNL